MPNSNPANPGQPALIGDQEKQPSNNGTGFVNLQKYLDANQNNQLGNAVSGNINQATNATQADLAQQQNQFNSGLSQARSGLAQNQSNVAGTLNAINNPNFTQLTPSQVSGFQTFETTPYSGPTGFSNSPYLQQQAANAGALGQLAGSRAGRQQLLAQTINAPNYTPQEQNMDELFMSLGNGNQQVQQAGRGTRQLQNQVGNAVNIANQQGTNAQNAYNNAQQQAASQVSQQQSATNAAIANAVAQDQANYQGTITPIQNALATNTLTQAQANALGIGNLYGTPLYNASLSTPFQGVQPTTGTVTTPLQASQLQALAQLSNQQIPQFNSSQLGTYNPAAPYTYNVNELQNALNQGNANYQTAAARVPAELQQWIQQNIPAMSGYYATPNITYLGSGQNSSSTQFHNSPYGTGGSAAAADARIAAEQAALESALAQQYGANVGIGGNQIGLPNVSQRHEV